MSDIPAGRTEAGRFPPGVSGNPNGRPKDQFSFMGILRSALAEENKSGKSVGERIIARYIKLALAGNGQALEALVARIDGKPAQSLTLRGESDAPLHVRHSARLEQEVKPAVRGPDIDMTELPSVAGPDITETVAPKPKLPAPEQEQEPVEGAAGDWTPVLGPSGQPLPGVLLDGDPDHPAPDVAE